MKNSRKTRPNTTGDTHLESLVASIPKLAQEAVAAYTPIVDDIIRNQSRNAQDIEHTLDGLLGFCFDQKALILFKRLCKHYYTINPNAAVDYVNAYREMWDSKPEKGRS